jgi:hypothetical protein
MDENWSFQRAHTPAFCLINERGGQARVCCLRYSGVVLNPQDAMMDIA